MTLAIRTDPLRCSRRRRSRRAPGEDVPELSEGARRPTWRAIPEPVWPCGQPRRFVLRAGGFSLGVRPPFTQALRDFGFDHGRAALANPGRTAGRQVNAAWPCAAGTGPTTSRRRLVSLGRPVPRRPRTVTEPPHAARRSGSDVPLYRSPPVGRGVDPRPMPQPWARYPVRAAAYEFANYAYVEDMPMSGSGRSDALTIHSVARAGQRVIQFLLCVASGRSANPRRRPSDSVLSRATRCRLYLRSPRPKTPGVAQDQARTAEDYVVARTSGLNNADDRGGVAGRILPRHAQRRDLQSLSTLDLSASPNRTTPYTQDDAMDDLYRYILRDVAGTESTEPISLQHLPLINVIRNAGVVTQTRRSARIGFRVRRRDAARCRGALLPREDGPGFPEMDSDPVRRAADAERRFPWSVRRWITSVTGCCST